MAVLQTGQSFASGDQVTATKLEDIANLSTFVTGTNNTADGSTIQVDSVGGYLKVPSNGIGSNELSSDASVDANRAVDTNHIKDTSVTYGKIQNVAASSVIGNTTGSAATPTNVAILDEDDMASNSATSLATQKSIKAYVDAGLTNIVNKYSSSWIGSLTNGGTYTFSHTLGTAEAQVQVYMATSSAGANIKLCQYDSNDVVGSSDLSRGVFVTNINSSTIEVQLANNGWVYLNSSGNRTANNWGTTYTHIKVVAIG